MLSMSPISGGQASSGYYTAEGYYIAGSPEAEQAAQYFGKAASDAGLTGRIDDAAFAKLLEGITPDGTQIGRLRDGTWEHRAGLDLTFSAPKGVSIAALVGGDTRVTEAHHAAVREAMGYVERFLVQTRMQVNGEMEAVTGGKIIAGLFQHDTSRALDPQLHTHAVIANMVKTADGQFRALHNDTLFRNTLLVGQIYRNALATRLEALGYTIERGEKGLFDIKEVPAKLIDHFSKRREEIEASLKERDLNPNARNSALAALATRSKKAPVERGDLYAAWDAEAKGLGVFLKEPMAREQTDPSLIPAGRAVDYAVSHLSERQSIYEKSEVVRTAILYEPRLKAEAVETEIRDRLAARELFAVLHKGEPHLTDRETARIERENIGMMRRECNSAKVDVRTLADKLSLRRTEAIITRRLERSDSLTEGQKEAALLILTGRDRMVGVQGLAGTGKTYMLATVARQLEKAGYSIEGLAPSLKAVSELSEAIKDSRTLASALVRHENAPGTADKNNTVLVVDEASMISTRQMNALIKMANDKGYARVALVGDVRQLDAVSAGSSFRQLVDAGMTTALMTDIQRQNTDEGRTAVLHAYRGEVKAAFEGIANIVQTEDSRSAIAAEIAAQYLARDAAARAQTGLIVMTNAMRREVNAAVQAGLRAQGVVTGPVVQLNSLAPRNLTRAEAGEIASYRTGDIIAALKTLKTQDLTAGTLYEVTKIDVDTRRMTLTDSSGQSRDIALGPRQRLGQHLVAYRPTHEGFARGDEVKFRITDRASGIENANTGTVTAIDHRTVTVHSDRGDITLGTETLAVRGMQLAYAATAHDFQGSTVDHVILGMHSTERLATQKAFYVGLSRMRDDTALVTDDAGKLAATIQRNSGARVNALEALAENKQPFQERGALTLERSRSEDEKSRDAPEIHHKDAPEKPRGTDDRARKETDDKALEDSPIKSIDGRELTDIDRRLNALIDEMNQRQLNQKIL